MPQRTYDKPKNPIYYTGLNQWLPALFASEHWRKSKSSVWLRLVTLEKLFEPQNDQSIKYVKNGKVDKNEHTICVSENLFFLKNLFPNPLTILSPCGGGPSHMLGTTGLKYQTIYNIYKY